MDQAPAGRAVLALLVQSIQGLNVATMIAGTIGLMGVGGTCAVGGPYEIRSACPGFVAVSLTAALPVFFILLFAYSMVRPRVWAAMSFWPAIFMFFGIGIAFVGSALAALQAGETGTAIGIFLVGLMMLGLGAGAAWLFGRIGPASRSEPWW